MSMNRLRKPNTSWEDVSSWYHSATGEKGSFYHQQVIFPNLLPALNLSAADNVLDLGCGQGVFERQLPQEVGYLGLDGSKTLLALAEKTKRSQKHHFAFTDLTRHWPNDKKDFTVAVMILSAQNVENLKPVFEQAAQHLVASGRLVLVLNHPCFRIPRQSSWEIDTKNHLEFRRINRYLTPLKVPLTAHPGKRSNQVTWSFHLPISGYCDLLKQNGFIIENLEEWTSPKASVGKAAKMENRARSEFPLFLTIFAKKI
jgi:SAM-dependent methyltransferase